MTQDWLRPVSTKHSAGLRKRMKGSRTALRCDSGMFCQPSEFIIDGSANPSFGGVFKENPGAVERGDHCSADYWRRPPDKGEVGGSSPPRPAIQITSNRSFDRCSDESDSDYLPISASTGQCLELYRHPAIAQCHLRLHDPLGAADEATTEGNTGGRSLNFTSSEGHTGEHPMTFNQAKVIIVGACPYGNDRRDGTRAPRHSGPAHRRVGFSKSKDGPSKPSTCRPDSV